MNVVKQLPGVRRVVFCFTTFNVKNNCELRGLYWWNRPKSHHTIKSTPISYEERGNAAAGLAGHRSI